MISMKILDKRVGINIEGLSLRGISSPEEILLFDIETTGLKKEYCQVYLIGCAYLDTDGWHIRQWLTESALDEVNVLKAFADFACGFETLVTFNGEGFDIPFIDFKNRYYGLDFDIRALESFDIYRSAKCLKKLLGLTSLKQKSVEEFLGIKREDKLNGGLLIPYYYEYEMTKSKVNEDLLLLHNFEDVLGMSEILPVLNYLDILEGNFAFSGYKLEENKISLQFTLDCTLPVMFKNERISGSENVIIVFLKVQDGNVYIPVRDTENYWYLPVEDRIIHKDLASFVDKKFRKKATRENCYLKIDTGRLSDVTDEEFKSFAMNVIGCY